MKLGQLIARVRRTFSRSRRRARSTVARRPKGAKGAKGSEGAKGAEGSSTRRSKGAENSYAWPRLCREDDYTQEARCMLI